jgi:hypothetical protein
MAGTIGKVMVDAIRTAKPAMKGPTRDTLALRKLQEMRREITRLAAAVQQAEHIVAAGTARPYSMDQLRGWVVSLAESQHYIDCLGFGYGQFPVDWQVQKAAIIAQRRAHADLLLVSRS